MKEQNCQIVSKEELVAYADGELSANEAERIAEHIDACPICQAVAEALERSLQVTQAIWQTGQAEWPETHLFDESRVNRRSFRKVMSVAASILVVLASAALWQLLPKPGEHMRVINDEVKITELKHKIADSSDASRLLAAAELLSKYPGTESSIEQRYRHIVETYPETAAAAKARLKIQ